MILNKEEIRELIEKKNLITGYVALETQLTENGFDLTVQDIGEFLSEGVLDFDNSKRLISDVKWCIWEGVGYLFLPVGIYLARFNETLRIPLNLCAESIHRSTLMRCGVGTSAGYWESGYHGQGFTFLDVKNPRGFLLYRNARICQIRFKRVKPVSRGYNGIYQNEGVKRG